MSLLRRVLDDMFPPIVILLTAAMNFGAWMVMALGNIRGDWPFWTVLAVGWGALGVAQLRSIHLHGLVRQ